MTRRTTCTVAVVAAVALAPAVALANGGNGPQGELVICHDGATLTIPAAQWWPYGYLGATKGACPEPSATPTPEPTETPTPTATPVVTPEATPTSTPESSVTPTPYDGDYVPTGPTSGGYGIATATPTPVAAATPLPPTILQEPTPAPIAAPTPTATPVASSTAVVPRPADTGHGDSGRSHPLRALLIAPTVAVALLFGARSTTRERGA